MDIGEHDFSLASHRRAGRLPRDSPAKARAGAWACERMGVRMTPPTAPRLTQYRTMLAVADLRRTQEFYTRLGFEVVGEFGEPPVWTEMVRDSVALMFNAPD